ncbi:glycoside hydrolase family 43 protein [Sediminibacillus halophilus]|uniref:Xylan 1,4-beta-xylosidase n=1 Tax=Sediminibacillus halophilus TaxID=482461 RepID=A0A1G9RJK7_9BACI|nr:glycoside hydrolase family 43 protein [Sediminibacillus halophilus]SDM23446.1 xylan 1,4-beta-xylosidase [Sediminibacillus halophilus]
MQIDNPILPGFHPDPSILRVGDDFYIAVSTFEWFPGVQIYHSRDLLHWELLTHALTRDSQLQMIGNVNSGGVWAPCLSYSDGVFYLLFTDVKSRKGAFKDTHNYLVTAEKITGPWSEPIYLNSSGFDPSLFHDEDGKKWLLNMIWDHRKGKNSFAGIALQQFSLEENKLVGPVWNIFSGTELGATEAPHLYKKDGYYHLMTAEGGTSYDHAVTMARSESITGPYQLDPGNPILTSDKSKVDELQKAGHGSLVETQAGEWYLAHLCARPVTNNKCILGRETGLQKCYWTDDGWLRVKGGPNPQWLVSGPDIELAPVELESNHDDFQEKELKRYWNALRQPFSEEWLSLKERDGYLRLKGGESLSSLHRQSLLARRLESFHITAETAVDFQPETFQQMAGLIVYYDTDDYVYLRISHDEQLGKCLGVLYTKHGIYDELLPEDIALPEKSLYYLRVEIHRENLQFSYSLDKKTWNVIGHEVDFSHLADDATELNSLRFTGTFVGMCCQDLSGGKHVADFDHFIYTELDN